MKRAELTKEFKDNLRSARATLGLTAGEVAAGTGLHKSTYGAIETSQRYIEDGTLKKIVDFFIAKKAPLRVVLDATSSTPWRKGAASNVTLTMLRKAMVKYKTRTKKTWKSVAEAMGATRSDINYILHMTNATPPVIDKWWKIIQEVEKKDAPEHATTKKKVVKAPIRKLKVVNARKVAKRSVVVQRMPLAILGALARILRDQKLTDDIIEVSGWVESMGHTLGDVLQAASS